MKIRFIVGDPPLFIASNWNEIIDFAKKGISGYSYEDYSKVIGLETIKDLEDEIINSRKNLKIPKEGFDYTKIISKIALPTPFNTDNKHERENIEMEIKRLNEIFLFDFYIQRQLPSLILGNFVLPSNQNSNIDGDINYEVIGEDDDQGHKIREVVSINITAPVTFNKLKTFIKDNWKDLEIEHLQKKKTFNIEDTELLIVDLRDNKKLSFPKVATELVKLTKISDPKGKKNETSVKVAYGRTKDKLDSLVRRR